MDNTHHSATQPGVVDQPSTTPLTEEQIVELEESFPAMAGAAFAKANAETLAAGLSVVQNENGVIYEIFPDGTRIERKRIEPPTLIAIGTKAYLR